MKMHRIRGRQGSVPAGRVGVPHPVIPALRQRRHIVEQLAQVTRRPTCEVMERLRNEDAKIGSSVRHAMEGQGLPWYEHSEGMVRFYEQTDAFLFESLVWNTTRHKNAMRRWIARFLARSLGRPARVLMFGDGLGIDSYYLAQAGHEIEMVEVSQACVRMAEGLFRTGGMEVRIHTDLAGVGPGQFDVVVCLDVLEHVPNPPALVTQLGQKLRDGGYFVVHAPFFYIHPAVCTHLRANRQFSGDIRRLYTPCGLHLVDGRLTWDPIVLIKTNHPGPARWRTRLLRLMGLVLAAGRYWSTPHSSVAHWLTRARVVRWNDALDADVGLGAVREQRSQTVP